MNALIYGASGSGKTVNTTRLPGNNLLLNTDNSSLVLKHFDRPNLTIVKVERYLNDKGQAEFINNLRSAFNDGKYDNIIIDNVSDVFEMAILEYEEKAVHRDMRRAYLDVYNALRRISRASAYSKSNIVFTAWEDQVESINAKGERALRCQPKIPSKILDDFCGLMNAVGRVVKGSSDYGFMFGSEQGTVFGKDQIGKNRSYCKPEELFLDNEKLGGKKND